MRRSTLVLLAGLLCSAVPAVARERPTTPPGGDGRFIVMFKPSAGPVDEATHAREHAGGFQATHIFHQAVRGFAARLNAHQQEVLRADPDVASVTQDRPVRALGAVRAGETVPTGVQRVGAAASGAARGASTAAVAVIDTGVDLSHPDLNAHAGVDCTGTGSSRDDEGHGTHIAGTIGARNDGAGVVGVAPGTALYSVKVLDSTGGGYDSFVICGLDWVDEHAGELGIGVANMSLGGLGTHSTCGTDADPLHEAVCATTAAGVTIVVAAGNDGSDFGGDPPQTPAWYPEVLTVTAMSDGDGLPGGARSPSCTAAESDDTLASFSNFALDGADAAHTIAAPGVCILSTYLDGGYAVGSGTSMAAPHVAAEVALCIGEGGAPGPCAGLDPAERVAAMRADAAEGAVGSSGFSGDPDHVYAHRFYGYLGLAPGASLLAPTSSASPSPPAPASTPPPPPTGPATYSAALRRCRTVRVRKRFVRRRVHLHRRHGRVVRRHVHRRAYWRVVRRVRCS